MADARAQAFPPQFANVLQRTQYTIFIGDVNGDGFSDVLAKAKPKTILIDYEIPIPVALKTPSPTFVLLSQGGNPYVLNANPSTATIGSSVWQPNSYDVAFGDVIGNGSVSLLIRGRSASQPSFLISTSAATGAPVLLEELTPARIGYELSASGTSASLNDSNRDGRADLVIRRNGLIELVLTADAQGMFSKPATDSDSIMVTWRSFCASLDSADSNSAARFITEEGRTIYVPALEDLGPALGGLTATWSEPKAVRVGSIFAVFGLRQTVGGATRLHLIRFMRENGQWLLEDF